MSYTFALVGNPNSGKTTMFNEITGSTQYVGNWPGVTVEKKEGRARKFKEDIKIIDLPGIYSLSPYSLEEIIARDYLVDEKPDVVINIVDASNIERNLYLTTELLELGLPIVVALNMMDIVSSKGDQIDIAKLTKDLGIPIVPTSASKGKGIEDVISKALSVAQTAVVAESQSKKVRYEDQIEQSLETIGDLIAEYGEKYNYNKRWLALKLLEEDQKLKEKIDLSSAAEKTVKDWIEKLRQEYDDDPETLIADGRYQFIAQVINQTVKKKAKGDNLTVSDKIDKVVTNRILAIPIFLLMMWGVFRVTFGVVGTWTIDFLDVFINDTVAGILSSGLESLGAAEWLHALVIDGIIGGVGGVLVFVPQIMLLFFFLSLLEDSGYMARAAFIMDKALRRIGLSGKSFIPMLMGFGCSVPAVMATRTLEKDTDRKLTIILTPFMSCGAKFPIYALFTAAFFAQGQSTVIFSIYVLGMLIAIISGIILKKTVFKGDTAPFVIELPPYRIPTLKGTLIHMWDRGKAFLIKAGTVIFSAAVVIWFLQTFSFTLQMVEDPATSILGVIGHILAPIFAPLGFGDWISATAMATGLIAKEVVVASLGILHGVGEVAEDSVALHQVLQTVFTPLKAYSFMAFSLLYFPCIAAFGAMKRELNSWKWTFFAVGYQTVVAWIVAFLIYNVGRLIGLS